MLWSDFTTAVLGHLSVDATRRGIENFRTSAIRNAVIDLQRYIVSYRVGQTTLYTETDLTPQGKAQIGTLPPFARPSRMYVEWLGVPLAAIVAPATTTPRDFSAADFSPTDFPTGAPAGPDFAPADFSPADFPVSAPVGPDFAPADFSPADFPTGTSGGASGTGDFSPTDFSSTDFLTGGAAVVGTPQPLINRNQLDYLPWGQRQAMISGMLPCRAYRYSISPQGRVFMIYPQIKAANLTQLLLVWDGIKETFASGDTVPFPVAASQAVALYVKSKIQRDVDKNIQLSRENERDYVAQRLALWREARTYLDAEKDDEENSPLIAPPSPP